MSNVIKIEKIEFFSIGDESTGIFSSEWSIEQEVYIEKENLENFRDCLLLAWEYIADDVNIYFTISGKSECIKE